MFPQQMRRMNLVFAAAAIASTALIAAGASSPAGAQNAASGSSMTDELVIRSLSLRYVRPSRIVALLVPGYTGGKAGAQEANAVLVRPEILPKGITALGGRDDRMTLTLRGRSDAVASLEEAIHLLDVKPTPVTLRVRLLRTALSTRLGDSPLETVVPNASVVGRVTLRTTSMETTQARITEQASGDLWTATLTPKVNRDGTLLLNWKVERTHSLSVPGPGNTVGNSVRTNTISGTLSRIRENRALRYETFVGPSEGEGPPQCRYVLEVTPTVPSEGAGRLRPNSR